MANSGRIPLWLVGLVGGLAVITAKPPTRPTSHNGIRPVFDIYHSYFYLLKTN
jgi:hypothetical protein